MDAIITHYNNLGILMTTKAIFGSKRDIASSNKRLGSLMGSTRIKIEFPDNTVQEYARKGLLWFKQ